MSLLTKAMMALGVGFLCITQVQSQTVTILESQTTHPLQDMDERWESACNELGYSSSIVSYDFLNQTCLVDYTDVLVISSAVISIDPFQISNLETFVESGGSLYIQGEFLDTFPGNRVFIEIVEHFGDNFTWGASGNEDIGPLGVGSIISNNYNMVDSLEYFWYGMDGTGVGPFTSLLSIGSNNYGYLYEPVGPYNGKVYSTTDQDWIRLDFGEKVIENMTIERFQRFKNCFDAFYFSQEIHLRKPNSDIYNFVLDKHKINPTESLFIDDTKENTDSAKKLGIHTWNIIPKKEDVVDLFNIKKNLF